MRLKDIKLAMALFIMLESVSNADVPGKRLKKKISRSLKKKIKEFKSTVSEVTYLDLVNKADKALIIARENMELTNGDDIKSVPINPGLVFSSIEQKEPGFLETFNINIKDVEEYDAIFEHLKLTLFTVMYVNRLYTEINKGELVMSKSVIENQIKQLEASANTHVALINAKQAEIDLYEEDDMSFEETELEELKASLEEINANIDKLQEQLVAFQ